MGDVRKPPITSEPTHTTATSANDLARWPAVVIRHPNEKHITGPRQADSEFLARGLAVSALAVPGEPRVWTSGCDAARNPNPLPRGLLFAEPRDRPREYLPQRPLPNAALAITIATPPFPLREPPMLRFAPLALYAALLGTTALAADPIKHGFLATGGETFIVDGTGKTAWTYPHATRDGWVLDNGNVLLALSKSKTYPGGAVVEVNKDGKTLFEFKGTQSEVNTVQWLADGKVLLTEAGDKPRVLEVTREGKIAAEVAIQAQTKDHHLQTRMTRKLANGNYLVPQLLDRVVREYDPTGKIVWEVKTPHMPFTAIRLPDGNTLIGCTLGNLVIEVNRDGKEVWRVTNDDLPSKLISDACGVQRLGNGNTVLTSYRTTAKQTKLFELTREKKVVWTYTDDRKVGIHHFQILDTNGKLEKNPLR